MYQARLGGVEHGAAQWIECLKGALGHHRWRRQSIVVHKLAAVGPAGRADLGYLLLHAEKESAAPGGNATCAPAP